MYIIKNALKSIGRSKGRNILIGVIVLVIAVSACLGLSIRQAAESAREDTLSTMSVTATISFDRQSMMSEMAKPEDGDTAKDFDKSDFKDMMNESSSLTLEEYEKYAEAESVDGFYYTMTASFNGSDGLEPVSNETDTTSNTLSSSTDEAKGSTQSQFGGSDSFENKGDMGGKNRVMGVQSDFSIVGYSSEEAMTSFKEGTASVSDGGRVFTEGTDQYECIITQELATYNSISVGDSIVVTNPNNEEETYTLSVVGFYTDTTANESSFSMMGSTVSDPANKIYMSYNALKKIVDASEASSTTETDEDTGREFETKISGSLSATYVFSDTQSYEQFEQQARDLGLDDSYTVSSSDITAFESSLAPLETLSTMAGYFLIVILAIGAIILIVLNIFNVRERKYEIGVLTAMGMKKGKVALQFLTEIFAVTIAAVIIGAAAGAVSAVPVTNALLAGQIESKQTQSDRQEANFGRGGGDMPTSPDKAEIGGDKGGNFGDRFAGIFGEEAADYITEVNSAMNLTVVFQMLGIAVLLTLVSGMVSMLFVMRYEPLKILANRD